jgi:hypothetical protein
MNEKPPAKSTGITFDGTPTGPTRKINLAVGEDVAPALDRPRPPEESPAEPGEHPWQTAMRRIGQGGSMLQLKAALMETAWNQRHGG